MVRWEHCRVCEGGLEQLLSLGDIHINDFPEGEPTREKVPINLMKCDSCGLVQLEHTAEQELLYSGHYWYQSGINQKIIDDLEEIARISMAMCKEGDTIMDVGANDGTLLSFVTKKYYSIGVEPASNLEKKLAKHCDEYSTDFWEDATVPKAKIITAIGMFYDTDDPVKFVSKIADRLEEGGTFIAQLMTAKQMAENNDLGNLCHEHLEYYTYDTLRRLYEQAGLEIFNVVENDINGGSYRIFARHYDKGSIGYREPEIDWKQFEKNLKQNKNDLLDYMANNGGRYYIYGASTKGNLIAEYYGLDESNVIGAADANSEKWGKRTTTGIPIVSEEEARKEADYFIMMPYGFKDVFLKREKEWLEHGKFLIPLPEFHVAN